MLDLTNPLQVNFGGGMSIAVSLITSNARGPDPVIVQQLYYPYSIWTFDATGRRPTGVYSLENVPERQMTDTEIMDAMEKYNLVFQRWNPSNELICCRIGGHARADGSNRREAVQNWVRKFREKP